VIQFHGKLGEKTVLLDGMEHLSLKAASELSGYHSDYIGRLARKKKIPSQRVGVQWFVEKKSFLAYINERKSNFGLEAETVKIILTKSSVSETTKTKAPPKQEVKKKEIAESAKISKKDLFKHDDDFPFVIPIYKPPAPSISDQLRVFKPHFENIKKPILILAAFFTIFVFGKTFAQNGGGYDLMARKNFEASVAAFENLNNNIKIAGIVVTDLTLANLDKLSSLPQAFLPEVGIKDIAEGIYFISDSSVEYSSGSFRANRQMVSKLAGRLSIGGKVLSSHLSRIPRGLAAGMNGWRKNLSRVVQYPAGRWLDLFSQVSQKISEMNPVGNSRAAFKSSRELLKTLTGDVGRRDVISRPLNSIVSRVRELARDIRPSARMSEKRPAPSRWAFSNGINSLEFSKFFQKIPNILTSITHKLLTYSGSLKESGQYAVDSLSASIPNPRIQIKEKLSSAGSFFSDLGRKILTFIGIGESDNYDRVADNEPIDPQKAPESKITEPQVPEKIAANPPSKGTLKKPPEIVLEPSIGPKQSTPSASKSNVEVELSGLRNRIEKIESSGFTFYTPGERIVERILAGVSEKDLDLRLILLNESIKSNLSQMQKQIDSNFNSIALTQRINTLGNVTITSPVITGCSGCGGGSGTVDSGLAGHIAFFQSDGTSVNDTSNLFWDETNDLFGIATSTPAQLLSVSGNGYFTGGLGIGVATTTAGVIETSGKLYLGGSLFSASTATSTLTGGLSANHLALTKALTVSGSGTSTFAGGIQLSSGCFLLPNGSCAGTGSGTATATSTFHYFDAEKLLTSSVRATSTALSFWTSGTNRANFGADGAFNLVGVFNASSTLHATGNALFGASVGIATGTPTQELSVVGDGYFTGGLGVGVSTSTAGAIETSGKIYAGGSISSAAGTSSFSGLGASSLAISKALTISGSGTSTFTGGGIFGGLESSEGLLISGGNLVLDGQSFNSLLGTGLSNSGGALTLNATGDWTGTIDGNNFAGGAIGIGELIYGGSAGSFSELAAGTRGNILGFTTGGIPGWISTSTFAHISAANAFTGANIFSGLNSFTNTGTTSFKGGVDVYDSLAVGRTVGTTTILGGATSTFASGATFGTGGILSSDGLTLSGGVLTSASQGTSTFTGGITADGLLLTDGLTSKFINTTGTATSSFTGGISLNHLSATKGLTISGANSTSTFAGGVSITGGGLKIDLADCSGANTLDVVSGAVVCGTDDGGSAATSTLHWFDVGRVLTTSVRATSTALTLWTNGSERARFDTSGNFGFASTTPWGGFSVEQLAGQLPSKPIFAVSDTGTSSPFMFISQKGVVGFGTSSPTNLLLNAGDVAIGRGAGSTNDLYISGGLGIGNATTSDGTLETSGIAYIGGTGTSSILGNLRLAGNLKTSNALFDGNYFGMGSSSASALTIAFNRSATTTIPTNTNYAWTIATTTAGKTALLSFNTIGPRATTTLNSGFVIDGGAFQYDSSSKITSIDSINTGPMAFETDAGVVSWMDLPTATTTASLANSYSAQIGGTPVLTIYATTTTSGTITKGFVGIGSTTPSGKAYLSVGGAVFIHGAAKQSDLKVFNGAICADNNGTAKCQAALTAGTVYGDTSSFGASDIAENYPIADDSIESGDIVMIAASSTTKDDQKLKADKDLASDEFEQASSTLNSLLTASVTKADKDNVRKIIGVISSEPGVLLGDATGIKLESKVKPVALSGRVPVKVSSENGPISEGDLITISSVPGVGMKANDDSETTIGVALQAFNSEEAGQIMVFVNLGYSRLDKKISELAAGSSTISGAFAENAWGISAGSGKVYTGYTADFQNNDIINVRNILSASGNWSIDESGKLVLKEIETEKLKVEAGITTKDRSTGDYYCMFVENGEVKTEKGECFSVDDSQNSDTPSADSGQADSGAPAEEQNSNDQPDSNLPAGESGADVQNPAPEPTPTQTPMADATLTTEPTPTPTPEPAVENLSIETLSI